MVEIFVLIAFKQFNPTGSDQIPASGWICWAPGYPLKEIAAVRMTRRAAENAVRAQLARLDWTDRQHKKISGGIEDVDTLRVPLTVREDLSAA